MSVRTVDEETPAVRHLRSDPALARLVDEHGSLALAPAEDPFQRLVVAILRQQVSMASAAATRDRLFEAVEVTPGGILAADEATLRGAGLSSAKATYVRNVARAHADGEVGRERFRDEPDEAVVEGLTAVGGIGPWTAKMYLMFCLGREDVFPVEDLGIRRAMAELYDPEMTRGEMRDRAEDWRPYRSIASLYLWEEFG